METVKLSGPTSKLSMSGKAGKAAAKPPEEDDDADGASSSGLEAQWSNASAQGDIKKKRMPMLNSDKYEEVNIPRLAQWDSSTAKLYGTVVAIGKRRTGKSFAFRHILHSLAEHFPAGLCISQTDELNKYWRQYMPAKYIFSKFDPEILHVVFDRQKSILNDPRLTEEERETKARFFIILDDVISDKRIRYDAAIAELFVAGRHYKLFTMIKTHSPTPRARSSEHLTLLGALYIAALFIAPLVAALLLLAALFLIWPFTSPSTCAASTNAITQFYKAQEDAKQAAAFVSDAPKLIAAIALLLAAADLIVTALLFVAALYLVWPSTSCGPSTSPSTCVAPTNDAIAQLRKAQADAAQAAAQASAQVRAPQAAAHAAAQAAHLRPEWQCLTDGKVWKPYDSRIAQALEKAYQSLVRWPVLYSLTARALVKPMCFDLSVDGKMVLFHADLARMVQTRLDNDTERSIRRQLCQRAQWVAMPSDGPASLLAEWSLPPETVWGVSGLSLLVAEAGSLRTRESLELNIALGHTARMCGAGQLTLPVRVDVCEVPVAVRARFEAARTHLGSGEEGVFHGTADATIGQIFQQGFKVGGDAGVPVANGSVHGNGVYSDTVLATALGYAKGKIKKVILARALPGRRGTSERHSQCDSWSGGAGAGSSWRIFRLGDQLLPMYVLHFA
ncbi:hypothetical protein T492DRAFT_907172 [Pavlovales sp. CCMP2436]|nr:hypothetical protein T492DRAFT_907172 [Pavlovales sp. CCMP2436]